MLIIVGDGSGREREASRVAGEAPRGRITAHYLLVELLPRLYNPAVCVAFDAVECPLFFVTILVSER